MIDSIEATVGIYLATLIISVLSGLVPVVNGELYLIAAIVVADDPVVALVLAVIVALGQMIAKIGLYHAARGATELGRSTRFGQKLERAQLLVERWQGKPLTLLFVSAVTGLPPFYLVSLLAGILRIRFGTFLLLGIVGRVIRFVALALIVLYW
ncbi:MAG TPA: VTT domain-containing protein [Kofleriaceae bacterium]|nr:VTT domain-containing protein [Kofleriaceae bacterium]